MKPIITEVITPSLFYARPNGAGMEILCLVNGKQTIFQPSDLQCIHLAADLMNYSVKNALAGLDTSPTKKRQDTSLPAG